MNRLRRQQVQVDHVLEEILRHSFERLPESLVLFRNSLSDELQGRRRAMGEVRAVETATKVAPAQDRTILEEPQELISAIRRCANAMPGDTCDGCPYSGREGNACQDSMLPDAARLPEKPTA